MSDFFLKCAVYVFGNDADADFLVLNVLNRKVIVNLLIEEVNRYLNLLGRDGE